MPASADDVARRLLARLWVDHAMGDRAALSELRRLIPQYPAAWATLPIDDRARARVEAWR